MGPCVTSIELLVSSVNADPRNAAAVNFPISFEVTRLQNRSNVSTRRGKPIYTDPEFVGAKFLHRAGVDNELIQKNYAEEAEKV